MNPGDLINSKYRIQEFLGQGGMGAVYLAENQDVGRKVAIKVMRPEFAANGEALARFKREARAAAAIGHPGIVDVFDMGTSADGAPFIVMELLHGQTLRQRAMAQPPLTVHEAVGLVAQVLDILQAAHSAGVIHRDLKPDNVFVVERPTPGIKILDFGVSKFQEGQGASVTQTGQVMGTPLYMSPEQARGARDVGALSDLYSVGAILYEVLSGRPPYPGDSFTEVLAKLLTETLPPLANLRPDLPVALQAAVERMLQKEASARFASAAEAAAVLRSCLHGSPGPLWSRPTTPEIPALGMTTPSAQRNVAISPAPSSSVPYSAAFPRRRWGPGLAVLGVAATGGVALMWHHAAPREPIVSPPLVVPAPVPAPPPLPTPAAMVPASPPPAPIPSPPTPPLATPAEPPAHEAAPAHSHSSSAKKHRAPVVAKADEHQVTPAGPAAPVPAPIPAEPTLGKGDPLRFTGFVDEDDRRSSPPQALPRRHYPQKVVIYQAKGRSSLSFDGPPPCRLYVSLPGPNAFIVDPNQSCTFTERGVVHPMQMTGKGSLNGSTLSVELSGKVLDSTVQFHSAFTGSLSH